MHLRHCLWPLLLAVSFACSVRSDLDARFAQQAGEVWYGIYLDEQKVGYARFAAYRDAGDYVFSSSAAVREPNGAWTHWEDRDRFAAAPPHHLVVRSNLRSRGGVSAETRLIRVSGRYLLRDAEHSETIDLDYRLRDRLDAAAERDGLTTRALDVDRGRVRERSWHPSGVGDGVLHDASGLRSAVLDGQQAPRMLTIGHGFRMQREPADLAVMVAEPRAVDALEVPLDGDIGAPDGVSRLVLRLPGQLARLIGSAPGQVVDDRGRWASLTITRTPERPPPPGRVGAPRAAFEALRAARMDERTRIRSLVALVHASLEYDAQVMPLGPRDALARGRGSCRDYASLFALWARELGVETRIVTGLAYLGDQRSAFGLHAWNEVRVNGAWLVVDPTWGQAPADATHIRLPLDPDAMLRAFEALDTLHFELIDVERSTARG